MKYILALLLIASSAFASLKMGTFNIRNFDMNGTRTNKELLKKELEIINVDLLAVQEIVNTNSFTNFINTNFNKYQVVLSRCGGSGRQKLGFVYDSSKLELTSSYEELSLSSIDGANCKSLRPGFVGLFKVKASGKKFAAISLHLKAGSGKKNFERRNKQYKLLGNIKKLLTYKGYSNILFMGDLNTTGYIHGDQDFKNFTSLLTSTKMTTVSEKVSCSSYWSGRDNTDGIEEASLLDHIAYTPNFLNSQPRNIQINGHCKKSDCENTDPASLGTIYEEVSDHCPLTFEIND